MEFSFQEIINQLNQGTPGSNFAWNIARAALTPSDYLFNSIIPNTEQPTFDVKGGNMIFTPTMVQGVPMDDHYPPIGAITSSTFFENTTKMGGSIFINEKQLRDMYQWELSLMAQARIMGGDVNGTLSVNDNTGLADNNTINGRRLNTLLGLSTMMLKAHWDTQEYLKGKALCYALIGGNDFKFMGVDLEVNYDIPATNKFTARTGNDKYGGSTSKFWTDIRALYKVLSNFEIFMNSNTYYSILDNGVNGLNVTANTKITRYHSVQRFQRIDTSKVTQIIDQRDSLSINIYDRSGSVMKTTNGSAALQTIPFLPDGKIFVVGDLEPIGLELTQGPVPNPDNNLQFGYNHIAPTVEGQMVPGIWSRIFTPQDKPMNLQAETAINQLPVILNPKKLVILTTDL